MRARKFEWWDRHKTRGNIRGVGYRIELTPDLIVVYSVNEIGRKTISLVSSTSGVIVNLLF